MVNDADLEPLWANIGELGTA